MPLDRAGPSKRAAEAKLRTVFPYAAANRPSTSDVVLAMPDLATTPV
jgi:hypothetical protein